MVSSFTMKVCLTVMCVIVLVLVFEPLHAQFRLHRISSLPSYKIGAPEAKPVVKSFIPGLKADKDAIVYKPSSPTIQVPVNSLQGDSYWIGSVTSQSYNQGKIGRLYYWDLQGNLRDSFLFLDVAGKNKRGIKLVFPKHRLIF